MLSSLDFDSVTASISMAFQWKQYLCTLMRDVYHARRDRSAPPWRTPRTPPYALADRRFARKECNSLTLCLIWIYHHRSRSCRASSSLALCNRTEQPQNVESFNSTILQNASPDTFQESHPCPAAYAMYRSSSNIAHLVYQSCRALLATSHEIILSL
mgnify:CR=1 FL=1